MTVQDVSRLLTPGEVADLFRCIRKTIRRLGVTGRLRAVRLSGAEGAPMRFEPADVRALVRADRTEGGPS